MGELGSKQKERNTRRGGERNVESNRKIMSPIQSLLISRI